VRAVKHTVSWTLENFPLLIQNGKGYVRKSPEFEINLIGQDSKPVSSKWFLQCTNSAGVRYEPLNTVLLYLFRSSQSEHSTNVIGNAKCSLGTNKKAWGLTSFDLDKGGKVLVGDFSYSDLNTKPIDYLVDNKLCITCDITLLTLGGPRSYACGSDSNPVGLRADIHATAWDRRAWEDLKAQTVVDLGPSIVTLVFGSDGKEEVCHTFPLAARSPVFKKMLTVDMREKASGRVEMPHISAETGMDTMEDPLGKGQ